MTLSELLKDGGYKSRKFVVVLISMMLVTAVGIVAGFYEGIRLIYVTFCGTILSLATLYLGANGALKYLQTKNAPEEP